VVRARIDSDTKARATAALEAVGAVRVRRHTPADAADCRRKAAAVCVQVPNSTTVKTMEELESGKGQRFNNEQALFDDLGL
jgi:DNA-damage-inducible protein J